MYKTLHESQTEIKLIKLLTLRLPDLCHMSGVYKVEVHCFITLKVWMHG